MAQQCFNLSCKEFCCITAGIETVCLALFIRYLPHHEYHSPYPKYSFSRTQYSSISSNKLLLTYFLFFKAISGEIHGCDAVRCPSGPQDSSECDIGNSTLKAIGIANFTTNVNPQPVTWTLGLHESYDTKNGTQLILDRNHYLGTPPSLQLANVTGCALFFEGIAAKLTIPHSLDATDKSTCSDVLSQSCVSYWTAQARTAADDLLGQVTERNSSYLCSRLGSSLQSNPPESCNSARSTWGTVAARHKPHTILFRELTDRFQLSPVRQRPRSLTWTNVTLRPAKTTTSLSYPVSGIAPRAASRYSSN